MTLTTHKIRVFKRIAVRKPNTLNKQIAMKKKEHKEIPRELED
jgi:hypothetical protein